MNTQSQLYEADTYLLVELPFEGFGETFLGDAISKELEQYYMPNNPLRAARYDWTKDPRVENLCVDYDVIAKAWAFEYMCCIFDEINLSASLATHYRKEHKDHVLTWKEGVPIMYKFESYQKGRDHAGGRNDRLFVHMTPGFVNIIGTTVSSKTFEQVVREYTTPREGYAPLYGVDRILAKELAQYDHNECKLLLTAFMQDHFDDAYPIEAVIADELSCKGIIGNAVYEMVGTTPPA